MHRKNLSTHPLNRLWNPIQSTHQKTPVWNPKLPSTRQESIDLGKQNYL